MIDHESTGTSVQGCLRCGTCCRKGGPALHLVDREIIARGLIQPGQLISVRPHEPVYNPVTASLDFIQEDFLKVGGRKGSWTCLFWQEDNRSCGIYRDRPLECRLLFCRDSRAIEEVIGRDLLSVGDLLPAGEAVLAETERLNRECPYELINRLTVEYLEQGRSFEILGKLAVLVRKDLSIRSEFCDNFPTVEDWELLLLGRPLYLILEALGFQVRNEHGSIFMMAS